MAIIITLILGSVFMFALAIASGTQSRPLRKRLARLGDGSTGLIDESEEPGVLGQAEQGWLITALAKLGDRATGSDSAAQHPIRKKLIQAGYRHDSAVVVFMGARLFLALVLPTILLVMSPVWDITERHLVALLCSAAAIGFVGPSYYLDKKRAARQWNIILALPDALDLMVVCVEAGLGINSSLHRISKEFKRSNPLLSSEFEQVTLEIRTGKSTTEALRALSERTGVSEIGALVAMLVQTERFGTSLADTLRIHADGLRVQRMLRAEEQASKAPLKMMFPTLIIFAATLLVTIGPGLLQLMGFFQNR
jgi:tight adherence protein C